MGRLGINYEQVASAAEQILNAGQSPTVERVRRALGDTGSNLTISKHLRDWKTERLKTGMTGGEGLALPYPLQKAMTEILDNLRADVDNETEGLRLNLETQLQSATEEKQALLKQLDNLEQALSQKNQETNHLQADLQLNQSSLLEERKQGTLLKQSLEQTTDLIASLKSEIHARAEEKKDRQEKQILELKLALDKTQAELEKVGNLLESQRQYFIVELDHCKTSKEKIQSQLTFNQTALTQSIAQAEENREQIRGLKADLKVIQGQYTALEKTKSHLEKEIIGLQAKLEAKEEVIAALKLQAKFNPEKSNRHKDRESD